jgi:hypothetical protein
VRDRTDRDWDALARDLSNRVAAFAPEWTDPAESDPGLTIVELFAFLTEEIGGRGGLSTRTRARFRQLVERLDPRLGDDPTDCGDATLTRVRYFFGQVLGVDDLDDEQAYHRARHRRHNRLLHGTGIVRGLEVSVEQAEPGQPTVLVSPGVAIAGDGEELVLCEPWSGPPCPGVATCYVVLRLRERLTAPVPAVLQGIEGVSGQETAGQEPGGEPSRIEETAEVVVLASVGPDDLAVARLNAGSAGWELDTSYAPARVGTA